MKNILSVKVKNQLKRWPPPPKKKDGKCRKNCIAIITTNDSRKPLCIFGEITNCSRRYIWLYTIGVQALTSAKIWTQWNQGGYITALTEKEPEPAFTLVFNVTFNFLIWKISTRVNKTAGIHCDTLQKCFLLSKWHVVPQFTHYSHVSLNDRDTFWEMRR